MIGDRTVPNRSGKSTRADLSLRELDRILRLDAGDGVIVVEAGVTIEAIRAATASIGLWCPPLRWLLASATIGAAVAGGQGKRSRAYGSVADHVLGLRFACPAVGIVKHGGAAIKNATGYNLSAIVAGSRGSFGVILEIILRLVPLPPLRQVATLSFATDDGLRTAMRELPAAKPGSDPNGATYLADAVEFSRSSESPGGTAVVEVEGIIENLVTGRLNELVGVGRDLGGLARPNVTDDQRISTDQVVYRSSISRQSINALLARLAAVASSDLKFRVAIEGIGGGIDLASASNGPESLRARLRDLGLPLPGVTSSVVEQRLKASFDPEDLLEFQPLLLHSYD